MLYHLEVVVVNADSDVLIWVGSEGAQLVIWLRLESIVVLIWVASVVSRCGGAAGEMPSDVLWDGAVQPTVDPCFLAFLDP